MLRRQRLTKSSGGRFARSGKARPVTVLSPNPGGDFVAGAELSVAVAPVRAAATESAAPIPPKPQRRGVLRVFSFPARLQAGRMLLGKAFSTNITANFAALF